MGHWERVVYMQLKPRRIRAGRENCGQNDDNGFRFLWDINSVFLQSAQEQHTVTSGWRTGL